MALDAIVDSTKLDACLDAEADAIRAKTGGSAVIPFDYANNKGFADAIEAISGGGGKPEQAGSGDHNGTFYPDSGKVFSSFTVAVPYTIYRTGSGAPSSSLGNDGDLYFDLG